MKRRKKKSTPRKKERPKFKTSIKQLTKPVENPIEEYETIFEEDELAMRQVQPEWNANQALRQKGIFFLKDLVPLLKLDSMMVRRHAQLLVEKGKDPWAVMGVRKIWNHWLVRMTIFAPYYRRNFKLKYKSVQPHWCGLDLVNEPGIFRLTDVARLLPISVQYFRYRAVTNPTETRSEFGVWKDQRFGIYLVNMKRFRRWANEKWDETSLAKMVETPIDPYQDRSKRLVPAE